MGESFVQMSLLGLSMLARRMLEPPSRILGGNCDVIKVVKLTD